MSSKAVVLVLCNTLDTLVLYCKALSYADCMHALAANVYNRVGDCLHACFGSMHACLWFGALWERTLQVNMHAMLYCMVSHSSHVSGNANEYPECTPTYQPEHKLAQLLAACKCPLF